MVCSSAWEKTCCSREARGPGVSGTGAAGGGEGDGPWGSICWAVLVGSELDVGAAIAPLIAVVAVDNLVVVVVVAGFEVEKVGQFRTRSHVHI